MNKEFRIWDAYLKQMTFGAGLSVEFTDGKLSAVDYSDKETSCGWSAVWGDIKKGERYFVNQYTGLTDSTGKKIFEGDILKWDDASGGKYWRVAQVIWNPKGCWTFRTLPNQCIGTMTDYTHDFNMGNFIYSPNTSEHGNVMEVLGNIFENPELLS